jgi:uncharacterized protein (TIGR03435 family)
LNPSLLKAMADRKLSDENGVYRYRRACTARVTIAAELTERAVPLIERFAVCLLVMASAFAQAQSFATIDVKPARSADPQSMRVRVLPNGDLIGTSVPVITLVSVGYGVPTNPSERLVSLPPWAYSERYDIEAHASSGAKRVGPSDRNARELVQQTFREILADRFQLAMRVEHRSMPVYALAVGSGGPKLKQSNLVDCIFDTGPDGCHSFVIGFGHPLNARAIDMNDLARYIENWTDLPVVDRTALTGLYTVSTEGWRPMRLPPPPPNGAGNVDFTQLPTIETILGGLGLELHKQVAGLPIYTVEHIEHPSTH